jgi:hypothetical protein
MVAHAWIPSNLRGRDQEDQSLMPAWTKSYHKSILTNNSCVWWGRPVTLATAGIINSRIKVQASQGIYVRPYLKNKQSKMGWGHGSGDRMPAYQA